MLRVWWDSIIENGPLLGYYPRADKSWPVVKEELLTEANEIFENSNVQITTEGHKYLGGFMGSEQARNGYAGKLVQKWMGTGQGTGQNCENRTASRLCCICFQVQTSLT